MKKLYPAILLIAFFTIRIEAQQRTYKDIELTLINDINLSDEGVYKAHSLTMNDRGDIAIFDYGETRLIHFNIESQIFNKIKKGIGRGPGEFKRVKNLKISRDKIYIADLDKSSIIVWRTNGEFDTEFKIKDKFVRPSRIAICEDNSSYILSLQYGPEGIFHNYNNEFKRSSSFKKIQEQDKRLPYYTDGNLACDEDGNLYHAARYLSSIKKYSRIGDVLFDVPVFNFEPNKKIIEKDGKWTSPAKGIRRASGNIYIFKNNVVVGFSNSTYIESKLIDLYNSQNGKYKYSIQVGEKFNEFAINEKYIVLLMESKTGDFHLKIYSFNSSLID